MLKAYCFFENSGSFVGVFGVVGLSRGVLLLLFCWREGGGGGWKSGCFSSKTNIEACFEAGFGCNYALSQDQSSLRALDIASVGCSRKYANACLAVMQQST